VSEDFILFPLPQGFMPFREEGRDKKEVSQYFILIPSPSGIYAL
jgi:hypothetical protein